MHRLTCAALAIGLAACGTDDDQRPRTTEYITMAILAPNCGNAQCHSQFRQADGYVFDTVDNARPHLVDIVGTLSIGTDGVPEGDINSSTLYNVLTREIDRMPYDQPLPDQDIELIQRWIQVGAFGAQCNPARFNARTCVGKTIYVCTDDFNLGNIVQECGAMDCRDGACVAPICPPGGCQ